MGDVINLSGAQPIDTQKVLDGAKHLNQLVIIGWAGNDFYMATSEPDLRDVLLLLEIAKRGVMDRILDGR